MMPIEPPEAASLFRSDGESHGGRVVAGVLSGTSADGIDVVVAEPRVEEDASGRLRLTALIQCQFSIEPFPSELHDRVRRVLDGDTPTLAEIATLHRDLGFAFGRAARAAHARSEAGPLALVASHGQTLWHHDGDPSHGKATLQLGDGDAVAEAAGCAAWTDFRARDCAAGGEGAPLVGLVDEVLFAGAPRPLALLNLGGISNWTLLGEGGPPMAFDCGPAGALLDGLSRRRLRAPYDEGGAAAARGSADERAVRELMGHPFIAREAPKSTGRDTFSEGWVDGVDDRLSELTTEDALATAVRFVARSVAVGLARSWQVPNLSPPVAVGGGGARNAALMDALRLEFERAGVAPSSFGRTDDFGVDSDAREALAFAALGVRGLLGEPSTVPSVTGAPVGRILGKWSPASR